MKHYLIYAGENSAEYGLFVGGQNSYNAPKRSVTKYSVPGRNGDLIKDNGRYENIQLKYTIVCKNDFEKLADSINAWLKVPTTYCRLEDSHHPEYYRLAVVTDDIAYTTGRLNKSAKATITFECKPQKWLVDAENAIIFAEAGKIFNPTRFTSQPLIRVNGSGSGEVIIGKQLIMISNIGGYIDLDSEQEDCFRGAENVNAAVTLRSGFPELQPGATEISFSGGITSVEVTGRWWTI